MDGTACLISSSSQAALVRFDVKIPLWSSLIHPVNSHIMYLGQANNTVTIFDTRWPTQSIASLYDPAMGEQRPGPFIHSLAMKGNTLWTASLWSVAAWQGLPSNGVPVMNSEGSEAETGISCVRLDSPNGQSKCFSLELCVEPDHFKEIHQNRISVCAGMRTNQNGTQYVFGTNPSIDPTLSSCPSVQVSCPSTQMTRFAMWASAPNGSQLSSMEPKEQNGKVRIAVPNDITRTVSSCHFLSLRGISFLSATL
jgi:hypothetical protein